MFDDLEKKVFRYEVGGVVYWEDPLAVRRALMRHSAGQFYNWQNDAIEPDKPESYVSPSPSDTSPSQQEMIEIARKASSVMVRLDAQERVLECVRKAFDLAPFDRATGQGVVEDDVWRVLDEFSRWLEKNERAAGS